MMVLVLCNSIEISFSGKGMLRQWGGGCCVSGVGDAASVRGVLHQRGGVLRQWRGAASVRRDITR